ncbi:MAG TPA: prepilin-type N-terminal cleavage/methylation domain-containing protein [Candidatus Eremiobacteraceae bacterium]
MKSQHGATLIEVIVALAILTLFTIAVVVPTFTMYARARAARDAADTLAQDIVLLERSAQNGVTMQGATLEIDSASPFSYSCYHGRPADLDPNTKLGVLIVQRTFADVSLGSGPINAATPLLFASNGSAQYYDGTQWVDQHGPPVAFTLTPAADPVHPVAVTLNLFTGEVSAP